MGNGLNSMMEWNGEYEIIPEKTKQKRVLPIWILEGVKRSEPPSTEKINSAEAEKNDSLTIDLKKRKTITKGVKNANLKKIKVIVKGVKNANLIAKPKLVNVKCVGQTSPSKNCQPKENILQINNQAFQKTMSNLKADLPSVPGAARPADRLSSNPAMMECLATAGSSVEVTNTNSAKMTQELPEKRSTTEGQAAEVARPAEGLNIIAARMEQTVDAKEDMQVVLQPTTVDAVRMGEWPEEEVA